METNTVTLTSGAQKRRRRTGPLRRTRPDADLHPPDHARAYLRPIAKRLPIHAADDEGAAEDSWKRMLAFFDEQMPG